MSPAPGAEGGIRAPQLRIEHVIPFRRAGTYAPFPVVELLVDGRLALAFPSNDGPFQDHGFAFDWNVMTSQDGGLVWTRADPHDVSIPYNWPGSGPRERWDRFAARLPSGSLLAAGAPGWVAWPAARRAEAEARGLLALPHPSGDADQVMVAENKVFVQRSRDEGRTWERREWEVPGAYRLTAFPRSVVLHDGTILVPLYDEHRRRGDRHHDRSWVFRSADGRGTWRLILMGQDAAAGWGDEAALVEAAPGRVLALMRQAPPGYLVQAWSDDGGRTWSQPLRTPIWGYPPHLLKLRDGRILCSFGHRRPPLGVQAVLSVDGGETWDVAHRAILRDDGETGEGKEVRDLGYPVSVELPDGTIFTTYYMTLGGVTHVAASRWQLPW
jgi:hypothetical protein